MWTMFFFFIKMMVKGNAIDSISNLGGLFLDLPGNQQSQSCPIQFKEGCAD